MPAQRALDSEFYSYFILITAKSEKDAVATGIGNGADDFLTRPVESNELRARIAAGERILKMQRELSAKNTLLTSTLAELQGLYDSLDRDLVEARHLQQSLVPDRFLQFAGANVSLLLRPSGHVGGDLVGAFRVNDNRIGLYSIDVSGHGIASALMTARIAGFFAGTSPERNIALTIDEFGIYDMRPTNDICESLNTLVLEDMETEHYFTAIIGDFDLRKGKLSFTQAGHPQPIVQRRDGSAEYVGGAGLPIGLIPEATFESFEITLEKGDRFFAHSDGFSECPNASGELLSEEGLLDLVRRNGGVEGSEFLETLIWDLSTYADGADFPDDVSGTLLEYGARP